MPVIITSVQYCTENPIQMQQIKGKVRIEYEEIKLFKYLKI